MMNQKNGGRISSVPAGLLAGAGVSVATTGLMTVLLAILLDREIMLWQNIGYGILLMIMLSAFLGAVTANRKIRRQKLVISCMSGIVYWGIQLSLTALLFGGKYEAVGVTALLIMAGCGCAAMLGTEKGSRGYPKKRMNRGFKS